jgi:hypothetical protein
MGLALDVQRPYTTFDPDKPGAVGREVTMPILPNPPPTPGDAHNRTRTPDQLASGALPLLTNRGAGGDLTNVRAIPPVGARAVGSIGKGYTPSLAEQGIEVPSSAELRPGTKGYYERTGVQPSVDAKTGKRIFVDATGQQVDEGALPLLSTSTPATFREQALADLRSSRKPNQPVLDALLGRGLERAFRSPDEIRNVRVSIDQLAWTNKNLGARGTSGVGGRAMEMINSQLNRESAERTSGQQTALALVLKAQEAQDAGDLERAKHLNNVALELIREEGATGRAKIAAGSREGAAETGAAARVETAAESAKAKREAALTAAEEKRQTSAFERMTKIYEKELANYMGEGAPPSFDDFAKRNPGLAKAAGYGPAEATEGVPKVGDVVVKYQKGKPVKVRVLGVDKYELVEE